MELDRDALDRWITGGRYQCAYIEVWCQNPQCKTYGIDPIEVLAETEYGGTTWTPEECPQCGGELGEDQPDLCDECGAPLADDEGEGYDGLCETCADKAEKEGRWS